MLGKSLQYRIYNTSIPCLAAMGCGKAFKFLPFEPVLRVSVAGNFLKEYNYELRAVTKL